MSSLRLLLLAVSLAACTRTDVGEIRTTACRVETLSPETGEAGVPLTFVVDITYTRDLDPASLGGVSVRQQGGGELPVAVEAAGPRAVRVRPLRTPRFGATYVVRAPGVADAAGAGCDVATSTFSTLTPAVVPRPPRPWGVESFAVAGTGADTVALTTAATGRGLQVWSLATPARPTLTGELLTPESPLHVAVDGDRAYLAADAAGVLVYDLSAPASPRRVGSFAAGGRVAQTVPFSRDGVRYVALADTAAGIWIFDVADVARPRLVGALDPAPGGEPGVRRIAIAGDLLAAAAGADGLALVSIADVTRPTVVRHRPDPGIETVDVELGGGWAWAALGFHGVRMFDIRDPAAPVLAGTIYGPTGACTVECRDYFTRPAYRDGRLFLPMRYTGTQVFDVTPSGLGPPRHWRSDGFVHLVETHAGQTYVAGDFGLEVWSAAADTRVTVADPAGGGSALGLSLSADARFAYLANGSRGVETFALDDPARPRRIDRDGTPSTRARADLPPVNTLVTPRGLVVADGRRRVVLFDLSRPEDPAQRGVVDGLDSSDALVVVDDVLYVCAGNGGVEAIDIAQLDAPVSMALVAFADIGRDLCLSLARSGDTLYVGTLTRLAMIDVSDARRPRWAGTASLPDGDAFPALAVSGDRLFAATVTPAGGPGARLQVFDIAAPRAPRVTYASEDLGGAGKLLVVGDILFLASGDRGIRIFDIAAGGPPIVETVVPTPGRASNLARRGEYVYVTQLAGGLDAMFIGPLPRTPP